MCDDVLLCACGRCLSGDAAHEIRQIFRFPIDVTLCAYVQAQRDFFGSHTYERTDGKEGSFHMVWDPNFGSSDSITTSGYNN